MGGSRWNDNDYTLKVTTKSSAGKATFDHDADVKAGKVSGVHEILDPLKMKGGVRESRDSAAHPESRPIIISLDVTGSVGKTAHTIHSKLPGLMSLLIRKNYISDPQILFMAIGDATCDRYPVQIGQFESGAEMEDNISKVIIEGGGGGQRFESYELAAFFGARMTQTDAWEKRQQKGYMFIIGDEYPYQTVNRDQVKEFLGGSIEANIPTERIFEELKERYTTFYLLPKDTTYGRYFSEVKAVWEKYVGPEHVLPLDDASAVAEVIATQIGLCEGTTDIDSASKDLEDIGSTGLVHVVRGAVSKAYAGGGSITKVDSGILTHVSKTTSVKRI